MSQPAPAPPGQPDTKPRGVLRPTFSQGQFEHHRQLPSPTLAGLVEHYWHVRWDLRGLPAQQQATLPHPNVHLVVEHGQARIYGVHHGRFMRQLQGLDQVFGIKFKPGGFYPFYRQPVAQLLNQSIDVTDCFGAEGVDLTEQVLAASNFEAMCAAAEAFLLHHLSAPDVLVARVSSLLERIAQDAAIVTVDDVLALSGLNKRGLQRLFQKYVGVGPKWVIQRYRIHEAIAQVQAGKALGWTALALELGYFDQAHFVRDFRQLVGMAPGEYEKSLADPG
ncbi:MAG: AraC family transcriptional regulator [Pseudomonadota bacterium]